MMVKLGELIEQIRGVSYKPEDLHPSLDENSVILLRANNIQEGQLCFDDVVYVDKKRIKNNQLLQAGDILICTSSGSKDLVGKACYVPENMKVTFGAFCKVVRPKAGATKYLAHYFQSPNYRSRISELSAGANINNIRNEHIDELVINYPDIRTQEEAVNRLDRVSDLMIFQKEQLQKLNELVKSRFIELFGDYNLANVQPNWLEISKIGTVVGGATPKTNNEEFWDGDFRWLTPAELEADTGYIFDSVRKLTKAGVDSCSLQELPVNTVILSSRAPIGKVAIAGNTFYCNQGFKNIICNDNIVPRYLYSLLLFNNEYLNSLGRGATFKEISKSIVENIRIPVPPIDLQNEFASFVEQTDKLKLEVKQSLEKLETLKKSLMQKYFG